MKQEKISGLALIAGTLGAVVTMVLHPVGGDLRDDLDYLTRAAPVIRGVHVLAIASVALQAFGLLGLARELGIERARVRAGLVAMVLAWIAVVGAATTSGLLAPGLIADFAEAQASGNAARQEALLALWGFNFHVNQSLTRIFIAGTACGMALWSWLSLGLGGAWRIGGWSGILLGLLGVAALFLPGLRLDVVGFGAFVAGYALWALFVGALLCRAPAVSSPS